MTDPDRQPAADPDDRRPWEQPGAVRRDCAPHRGALLLLLGKLSLVSGGASLFLAVPALLGLPLGIAVWVLAARDLARMRAGSMDPGGWEATWRARVQGIVGTMCGGGGLLFLVLLALTFLLS